MSWVVTTRRRACQFHLERAGPRPRHSGGRRGAAQLCLRWRAVIGNDVELGHPRRSRGVAATDACFAEEPPAAARRSASITLGGVLLGASDHRKDGLALGFDRYRDREALGLRQLLAVWRLAEPGSGVAAGCVEGRVWLGVMRARWRSSSWSIGRLPGARRRRVGAAPGGQHDQSGCVRSGRRKDA